MSKLQQAKQDLKDYLKYNEGLSVLENNCECSTSRCQYGCEYRGDVNDKQAIQYLKSKIHFAKLEEEIK